MKIDKKIIEERKDAEYLERVRERYEEQQNEARQLRKRQDALDLFSYAFNVGSILTAAYFFISFTGKYPLVWQIVFCVVLFGVAILWELAKRYSINHGAEGHRVWFIAVVVLIGISFAVSYEGGKRFTVEMATPPPAERNAAIDTLNAQIAAVNNDIAIWKKQTWRGKIVREARKGMNTLEQTKAALIAQKLQLEGRDLQRNDTKENEHKAEVYHFGNIFGAFAGAFDFALLICLMIARTDEKNARRLQGLTTPEKTKSVRGRSAPAPGVIPVPASHPEPVKVDTSMALYAERLSRQFSDLKQDVDELKASRAHAHVDTHARTPTHARTRTRTRARTHAHAREKVPHGTCKGCGKKFKPKSKRNAYCSSECREQHQKKN